ncbi:MAG: hypothetical protein ACRDK5_10020 [Solirubrobacterales bacterium]
MREETAQEPSILHVLCLALIALLHRDVVVTVLAPDGATIARFEGALACAFELPGEADRLLVIELEAGTVHVRPGDVERLERWSVALGGDSYASVGICLCNGLSVLIQEDLAQAFR